MLILKKDLKSLRIAASFLKKGDVIILPTDTVYGFSGIVPLTKDKIMKIKKREDEKNFISLISNPNDIYRYTDTPIPDKIFNLWPGPLTIIVKDKQGGGTSAFRCPNDHWLRNLIKETACPIYSTSVNYSGFPVLSDIEKIIKEFEDKVSLIVDGGNLNGVSSTIVSLTDKEPFILRQGSLFISF